MSAGRLRLEDMTEPSQIPRPQPRPDSEVERALVVVAHPDDADFGAAGTIAAWTDAGIEVTLLLCTRGEQGGFETPPATRSRPCARPSSGPPAQSSG